MLWPWNSSAKLDWHGSNCQHGRPSECYDHGDHMVFMVLEYLWSWGPDPLMRWGNIFYMFTARPGCFCWWYLPRMLACLRIRCKDMRTYWDQTFFKCKPSLNMLSLCVACDAPTSPCACIASAASRCGHCKQQSHTKMIQHVEWAWNGTWIGMVGICGNCQHGRPSQCFDNSDHMVFMVLEYLWSWGPDPLMRWGNIFYMFTAQPGCFCCWFLPTCWHATKLDAKTCEHIEIRHSSNANPV